MRTQSMLRAKTKPQRPAVDRPFEPLVGPIEIAEDLGCSRQTVVEMYKRGEIPGMRVGVNYKFDRQEVRAYAKRFVRMPKDDRAD